MCVYVCVVIRSIWSGILTVKQVKSIAYFTLRKRLPVKNIKLKKCIYLKILCCVDESVAPFRFSENKNVQNFANITHNNKTFS